MSYWGDLKDDDEGMAAPEPVRVAVIERRDQAWHPPRRGDGAPRYRVGDSVPNFGPPFAVLDDEQQEAIALCWHRERAQEIVDALNRKGSSRS